MKRATLVNFHMYTPFDKEFYSPILDFFLQQMKRYENEYDYLYLLDSNWEIEPKKIEDMKASIIRTNPNIRYYDCFKEILPQIKEDLVLFIDNDMVIYRKDIIRSTFDKLKEYDVVSIYDTIGTYTHPILKGQSKFCPYWFATRKDLLMEYRYCDWGDNMPHYETFGKLTQEMIAHDIKPYEWPEDKSGIYFDGSKTEEKGKNLGFYHIRAGSTPAVLLAWKNSPENRHTYEEYLKNQPKSEYLRQMAWFYEMSDKAKYYIATMLIDMNITSQQWIDEYMPRFREFHGL